jgi:receptor protein-tyrosine kinase
VVTNLAIAFAELSQRVLLIDCDMRRPRLHEIFDLPRGHGLAEYLSGKVSTREGLSSAVRSTSIPGLDILPAGGTGAGAGASVIPPMLFSSRMSRLLEHCENHYDFVLLDAPPLLNMPDARVLARLSDGVVLVICSGETPSDAIGAALEQLRSDGSRVLGTILNKWNSHKAGGVYKDYYESTGSHPSRV